MLCGLQVRQEAISWRDRGLGVLSLSMVGFLSGLVENERKEARCAIFLGLCPHRLRVE